MVHRAISDDAYPIITDMFQRIQILLMLIHFIQLRSTERTLVHMIIEMIAKLMPSTVRVLANFPLNRHSYFLTHVALLEARETSDRAIPNFSTPLPKCLGIELGQCEVGGMVDPKFCESDFLKISKRPPNSPCCVSQSSKREPPATKQLVKWYDEPARALSVSD
jgi:hypothetical protein